MDSFARALTLGAIALAASAPACSGGGGGGERTSATQAATTVPLVGRWSFSEGSGQVVHDTSGHGLDGTLGATASVDANDPTWSADGPSLVFAPPSYVHAPGSAAVVQTPHVAVELWIKDASSDATVLSVGSSANSDPTPAYALSAGPSGISFAVKVGGSTVQSPALAAAIWDGRWHFVAGTYDGANVRLFVDGNEVGSGTPASGSITYGAANDVWIGDSLGDPSTALAGGLDAVSIYSDALDPGTIAQDAGQRLGVPSEIPVPPTTIVPTAGGELSPLGGAAMSVDDFGQAHYHVPIWVPPGRNGIQPQLALDYSSRGGNDTYGVGWELGGLPRITRCRKKISGGASPPILFTADDGYCLNGQPLIGASADGTQFKTFKDDYSIVIAHDPDDSGPTWFEQRTKDGRILTFGGAASANARVEGSRTVTSPNPNDPNGTLTTSTWVRFGWALSRVQDRAGNFMAVTYEPSAGGDLLPLEIDYTGSAADPSTHRRVSFVYDEARRDVDETYVSGVRFTRPDRLARIEMYGPNPVESSLLRVFSLSYVTSPTTGRSLLGGVSECDGEPDGNAPRLCRQEAFTYTAGSNTFDDHDTGIAVATHSNQTATPKFAAFDVDGDGKDDILYRPASAPDGTYHLGISTGTDLVDWNTNIPVSWQKDPGPIPADFNGDGHGDVVLGASWLSFNPLTKKFQTVYGQRIFLATAPTASGGGWSLAPQSSLEWIGGVIGAGDVNGDHLPDLLLGNATVVPPYYMLNQGGNPPTFASSVQFGQMMTAAPYFVDVNGDGATDVFYPDPTNSDFASQRFMVQTARPTMGDPLGSPWQLSTIRSGSSDKPVTPLFGDFNGDGLIDVVLGKYPLASANDEPWYAVNTGQGYDLPFALNSTGISLSANRTMDWNLDGKADLVQRGTDMNGPIAVYTWTYDPAGDTFTPGVLPVLDGAAADGSDLQQFQVLDANGDGLDDIAMQTNGTLHLYVRHGVRPDMLAAASGSFGPSSSVTYKLTDQPDSKPAECVAPVHCVSGRMWVVDTMSVDNGIGGTNGYKHTFQNGRIDLPNWGFLGFESHVIQSLQTGSTTTRTFDLSANTSGAVPFYPLVGMPTEEVTTTPFVTDGISATRTSLHATEYYTSIAVAYTSTPNVVYETVVDNLPNNVVENVLEHDTRQSFDAYGNVTLRFEQWPLDSVTRNTTITYQNDVNDWLVSLPQLVTVTSQAKGGESQTRQTGYEFDANGQLFRVTQDPGPQTGGSFSPLPPQPDGVQTVYTEYQRNADGSPVRVWTEDHNDGTGDRRYVQIQYDSLERMFPVVTRDTLDHTVQTAYHPGLGVVAVRVDENGLATTYQYDTFGRSRAEHPPTGDDVTTQYGGPILYFPFGTTTQSRAGGAKVVSVLDSLGRVTLTTSTYRADGQPVYTSTSYDALGHVMTASRPYFGGATPANTVYSYDALGRVSQITYPDGSTMIKAYAGQMVATMDPNGNVKSVISDSLGRPVKSTQIVSRATSTTPGDSTVTQLTYGPFDTLEKVTDTLGNVVQTFYDRRGRPRIVLDPDEGARKTTYDAFGEVVDTVRGGTWNGTDVTGGDDTTTYHDADGRVTSVVSPKSYRAFAWDAAAHGIGKLGAVSLAPKGAMGAFVTYAYDAKSRLASRKWSSSLRKFAEIDYSYDAYNRADTVTYPQVPGRGPLVVKNNYSAGGQLVSVTDASSGFAYWSLTSSDASEAFPTEAFGNGAQTTWSEDPSHPGWLASITTTVAGAPVQSLNYHWEGHQRLHERDDNVNHTTETFGYDGLNRLTQWTWQQGSGPQRTVAYGYDDIGNLRTKTITGGAGASTTYTFDATHGPHQPASNGAGTYAYDAHGNQTAAPGRTVQYDDYDLPILITTSAGEYSFGYDAELHRTTRGDPSGEWIYSYGGVYEKRVEPDGTNHHVFTIAAKRPVAQIETVESGGVVSSETVRYLHVDHLGTVDTITDANGKPTPVKYEPFGLRVAASDPSTAITSPPDDVRTGFTGHEHDDDLGLVDMLGRVYDPVQQRFLSKDPAPANPTNSQALHPYAYVQNDPLNVADPSGLTDECDPETQSCPDPSGGDSGGGYSSSGDSGSSGYGSSPGNGDPGSSDGSGDVCSSFSCEPTDGSSDGEMSSPSYTPMDSSNDGETATEGYDGTSGPSSTDSASVVDSSPLVSESDAATLVSAADSARGIASDIVELAENAFEANPLGVSTATASLSWTSASGLQSWPARLKVGGYALAALHAYNDAMDRGDDWFGGLTSAVTGAISVGTSAPDSLVGGAANLVGMFTDGTTKDVMTQVAGSTAGSGAMGGAQFYVATLRVLYFGGDRDMDTLANNGLTGKYGTVVQNYSIVGQALAGNGNTIVDLAPTGQLGAPAQWGDALGDWLGRTIPSYSLTH